MLHVHNLQVGTRFAGLSFSVAPGEAVALVGSQGSGKSTLLRALAGLFGLPDARCLDLVKAGDLMAVIDTRVQKLRPGERARLRLIRALLHDPAVLLLDEPIGDVDRESQAIIAFVIAEAVDQGKAVLVATFGHPKAIELANRILYLEDGRLLEPAVEVPPAEYHAEPLRHIAARKGDRVLLYAPGDIRYAYAQEKVVYIETADGACQVNFTLAELEDRLTRDGFIRCHRGYVVNALWVKEIASWTRDSHSLILKDGHEVPLSKHRLQALRSQLGI